MDPATHALFGAALVCGASASPSRPVILTCAGASLLPDIDGVLMPGGWDRYLIAHEIGTHSIAGALLLAAVLAVAVGSRRGAGDRAAIWAAALAGTVGHVFWDVANGGDMRLFWPVWSVRMGGHLAAMADPVILVPLLLFGIAAWFWPRAARHAAAIVLLGLAGILVGRLALQQRALAAYEQADGRGMAERRAIEPEWGTLARWWIYDVSDGTVRAWRVDWTGPPEIRAQAATDAALAQSAARVVAPARRALALWDFAFARTRPCGAGEDVLVSDLRFCAGATCSLWFGGHRDSSGAFTEEVVIVGEWRRTRPLR